MSQPQHDRSQSLPGHWVMNKRWRTGSKVQRNIYVVVGAEPDSLADVYIGNMDTGFLAVCVVETHNQNLKEESRESWS